MRMCFCMNYIDILKYMDKAVSGYSLSVVLHSLLPTYLLNKLRKSGYILSSEANYCIKRILFEWYNNLIVKKQKEKDLDVSIDCIAAKYYLSSKRNTLLF